MRFHCSPNDSQVPTFVCCLANAFPDAIMAQYPAQQLRDTVSQCRDQSSPGGNLRDAIRQGRKRGLGEKG